jgi:hypothetical protein
MSPRFIHTQIGTLFPQERSPGIKVQVRDDISQSLDNSSTINKALLKNFSVEGPTTKRDLSEGRKK